MRLRKRVQRRCLDCHRLIPSGSRCKRCDAERWPDGPRTVPSDELRWRVLSDFSGCCGDCGKAGVPLELHHRDHDASNTARDNLIPLCRSCHRKAER